MVRNVSIVLRAVNKTFGSTHAVCDFSLEILPGELFVLLGPSGCGKTTVLRLVSGLEVPDTGAIEGAGRDWTDLAPRDRDVAMVFQNYALYPQRSVRGNIEYPLRVRGVAAEERRRLVEEVASLLGLTNLLDRSVRKLSGGEAQRVAVARALVRRPACFLLDEPLSSLDAIMRLKARIEIKRIQRTLGVTTLYVTHDQDEATALADRIGIMSEGRLVQVGSPEGITRNPLNAFVAGFLGRPSMNMFPAEVSQGDDCVSIALVPLVTGVATAVLRSRIKLPTGPILIGLRPHDIELAKDSEECRRSGWLLVAEHTLSEGIDPDVVTHFDAATGSVAVRAAGAAGLKKATLFLPMEKAYFFNKDGDRVKVSI